MVDKCNLIVFCRLGPESSVLNCVAGSGIYSGFQTKQSPKIGDKAPPCPLTCLTCPLTTEVRSHIRDLQPRHGQPCQPLWATSSFRESAQICIYMCTLQFCIHTFQTLWMEGKYMLNKYLHIKCLFFQEGLGEGVKPLNRQLLFLLRWWFLSNIDDFCLCRGHHLQWRQKPREAQTISTPFIW